MHAVIAIRFERHVLQARASQAIKQAVGGSTHAGDALIGTFFSDPRSRCRS
jgi:hypothetical protein